MAAKDQVPILQCVKHASARVILSGGSPSRSGLRICSLKQPRWVTVDGVAVLVSGCGCGWDILVSLFVVVVCVSGCVLAGCTGGMICVLFVVGVEVLLLWASEG